MCEFQTLYNGNDGYVIFCRRCRHYQVAFMCLCLTFNEKDFSSFRKMISHEYLKADYSVENYMKDIMIQTPAEGICFIFSKYELKRFYEILEDADSEHQVISLIGLFSQ